MVDGSGSCLYTIRWGLLESVHLMWCRVNYTFWIIVQEVEEH